MVDVKAAQADRFLKALPAGTVAVLLYGTDPGRIAERGSLLAQALSSHPTDILRLDDADLADDIDRLAVELRTVPMFGGRKIVRLRAEKAMRPDLLAELLSGPPLAAVLIVEAGNLKPDSKLRSLFAEAANAAAVACYPDDSQSLGAMIAETLAAHGMRLAAEAQHHLAELLGADRTLSRNEVEKLALYAAGRQTLTLDDIDAVVADASELAIDRVVMATASGETAMALHELDRCIASGESPQTVIVFLQRHFQRLLQIQAAVESGRPLDAALKSLRPPLHFKVQGEVAGQARRWSLLRLARALARIQADARAARLSSGLEREITERLVMELGGAAKSHSPGAASS